MADMSESPLERLWSEYSDVFKEFDDTTLARWMAQTLGQLQGRIWRFSHPLVGAYRLAAQVGHDRQVWLKLLATAPAAYPESVCCRAPLLPLFTRDVVESGLICQHCGGTAVPFDEILAPLQVKVKQWAEEYAPIHAVAHWEESERENAAEYDRAFERAASQAERLLASVSRDILPAFLEEYPAIVWEDQDECLEVRPEDLPLP